MALKAVLSESEYEALPDTLKTEYSKKSGEHYQAGKYYLDVERVEGFALEPVEGLKRALATERQSVDELKYRLKSFEGVDASKAKEALSKYEELQKMDPQGKAKEIAEAQIRQLVEKHKNELTSYDSRVNALKDQLRNELIVAAATKALAEHKGNVDLLLPLITQRTRIAEVDYGDGNYKLVPRVMTPDGQDAISQKPGSTEPMGISELVEGMKNDQKYAAAFLDTIAPGNNMGEGARSGVTMQSGKRTIKWDDQEAFERNIEAIAKGDIEIAE